MPTPFTHLASAQRLLDEDQLSAPGRSLLTAQLPAFLLGSIAADGHADVAGLRREDTHFYSYDRPISTPLPEAMLARYPALATPATASQRAFVAGYIGHLALDAIWTEQVTRPYFIDPVWSSSAERFLMLNMLLIGMDERDRSRLRPERMAELGRAAPENWLPFLPDAALVAWRDLVARQLEPGAPSSTLTIISLRTGVPVDELRALAGSHEALENRLWAHVPRRVVDETEVRMQCYAAEQVALYLDGASG